MKFLYNSLKGKKKQIVKVNFDTSTKVKLMTAFDLNKYKQGRTHRYRGGLFESGPVFFRLPSDGVWYAVVEKGTYSVPKNVKASVELMGPDKSIKESVAADAPANYTPPVVPDNEDKVEDVVEEAAEETQDEATDVVEGDSADRPDQ